MEMVSREAVGPTDGRVRVPEGVSCEDCRFMRVEDQDGGEVCICLARARRGVNPRERRECRRFLSAGERKMGLKGFGGSIGEIDDFFDVKHLNNLMSGKNK